MSKNHFNSNETLECCDVTVSQQGNISIDPKVYNTSAMERLGVPEKTVRGRVKVQEGRIQFDPYEEASRKPTFSKQACVGSTMIQCTEQKVKLSFSVPRHLRKDLFVLYIQSEIDEVKRRLVEDVYDTIIADTASEKGGSDE